MSKVFSNDDDLFIRKAVHLGCLTNILVDVIKADIEPEDDLRTF